MLDVALDFILAPDSEGFSSGASSTSQLAVLSSTRFCFIPKGTPSDNLRVPGHAEAAHRLALRHGAAIEPESGTTTIASNHPRSTT